MVIAVFAIAPMAISHMSVVLWFMWKFLYEVYRLHQSPKPLKESVSDAKG